MDFVVRHGALTNPLQPRRLDVGLAPGVQIVRREQWQHWCDAQGLMAEARRRAEEIVADAVAVRAAERRRGYEQGLESARVEQATEMVAHAARVAAFVAAAEGQLVDVVVQAIERLVAGFDQRERAAAIVGSVLGALRQQKRVVLRVRPEWVAPVQAVVAELAASSAVEFVDVLADPQLGPDACRAESDFGLVESSVAGQLRALRDAAAAILGERA